jgi:endonuclease/exonuclease/phosphatase family metal-dependent hydrolase
MTLTFLALGFAGLVWSAPRAGKNELVVGSFNIQIFGLRKLSKPHVVKELIKILPNFDMCHIMEIRDSTETAFPKFVAMLNEQTNGEFKYVIGHRTGRTNSKEQYAILYKDSMVNIRDSYVFNDVDDKFEREPIVALVEPKMSLSVEQFILIGIHTKPTDTPNEIEALKLVYDQASTKYNIKEAILMGDMNADCGYFNVGERKESHMYHDNHFKWLISDDADTTTKSTNCAYDRFAVSGKLREDGVCSDVMVYRFDLKDNMTGKAMTDVSDHFPVSMHLH